MAAVRPDCLARQEWEQKLLERGSLIRVVIGLHGLMTTPAPPRQSMRLLGDYITREAVGRAPAMIHLKGNEEFQQHVRDVVARLDALGIRSRTFPQVRTAHSAAALRRPRDVSQSQGHHAEARAGLRHHRRAAATAGAVTTCGASAPAATTAGAVTTGGAAITAGGGTRQAPPDNSKTLPQKGSTSTAHTWRIRW